jgi:adenosine kinase
VQTEAVHVSELKHTARFLCTTDLDQNQMASFYTGAMEEARFIELEPIAERFGGLDLVVISPNDPEAMLRHTDDCRRLEVPFMADPGQQLARMDGGQVRQLVEGARYLITNDYERALLETKTGWSSDDVLERVGSASRPWARRAAASRPLTARRWTSWPRRSATGVDPTGVGDAFRAGFLAGQAWGLDLGRSAEIGSMAATYVLEHVGTQEYTVRADDFLARFRAVYGDAAADEVAPHLIR